MNIIMEGRTGTGFTVAGESVMLSRYGDVYPTIDNLMHPNPGTEADEYSEIERSIDWLYLHDFAQVRTLINTWVAIRAAKELDMNSKQDTEEIIHNIFYDDTYKLSNNAHDYAVEMIALLRDNPNLIDEYLHKNELNVARDIAKFINEKFLRVRAGGKLNPEGADAIYFRISSHGYDWHSTIVDFLWDIFKDPKKMPRRIWIGHDLETNPPEIVLYDGTPEDLFNKFDEKIFESDMEFKNQTGHLIKEDLINYDRACDRRNRHHMLNWKVTHDGAYKPFI